MNSEINQLEQRINEVKDNVENKQKYEDFTTAKFE